jgi:hypothetical protein
MDSTMDDSDDCSEAVDMDSSDDSTVVSFNVLSQCSGNCIVNLSTILMALEQKAMCNTCQEVSLNDFFEFCDKKVEEIYDKVKMKYSTNTRLKSMKHNVGVRSWYKDWKNSLECKDNTSLLTLEETTYGQATTVSVCCSQCDKVVCEAKKNNFAFGNKERFMSVQHKFAFSLALQIMGFSGEHAAILTSFCRLT